ncbi:Panacea domain-containing protein [Brochothrix campestris]|uniref:Phage protein n=1 Tax=Brochothrix campestris FSL F6-1037 TaxID=1265861 RepID=W7CZ06_9LIST|nr:type II toxin-antitoxin system antitoxin SocA domain-containing protein [Brochothrix campestris]EUJ41990.1 phage protein [Brochothrix campestris FSL F6-1037]
MMGKTYDALDIAKYIIGKSEGGISNLRLQKTMYFLQGEYLAEYGKPLFDDIIEKWRLGPVTPSVYYNYNQFGSNPITEEKELYVTKSNVVWKSFDSAKLEDVKNFIDKVIKELSKYGDFDLVELTHAHPMWSNDEKDILSGVRHLQYKNDEIEKYFKKNSIVK